MSKLTSEIVSFTDKVGIVKSKDTGKSIEIRGRDKARVAVMQFSKYGLITFSRDQSFKSSQYSIHFIRPVEKLRQLYNLRDEVLIICCNGMKDFKSRTKDFIDHLISSEYRNRLDKVTCFLVDDSENIDDIIMRDRQENPDTRLIVPFSYEELSKNLDDANLQRKMRSYLYERDLFGIASPLKTDSLFFGKDRTNIISELYGKYLQGEHGGLFGLRRIGKTSILNMLQQRVKKDNGVSIYFDCSKYYHQRWNSFLHQIIREICNLYAYNIDNEDQLQLDKNFLIQKEASRYTDKRAKLSFEEDLTTLYHGLQNTRILLIFDEVESIGYSTSPTDNWRIGNDALFFWETLRAISQTNSNVFSFVIAGVNPMCIEISKINEYPNSIFNILKPIYVSLFSLNDVKDMVSDIGGHLGLQFEEEVFTKLIDDYGGHPFLTRQVCSLINAELLKRGENRPFTITKYSYEKQTREYQLNIMGVIEQILHVLQDFYPNEYTLLKILALDGRKTFKKEINSGDSSIPHLLGYCLIVKDGEDYFIRIRSIEEFLRNKFKYDKTLLTQSEKRTRISERRNKLELKLREIVYNSIRLQYGKKSKDRLLELIKNSITPDQMKKMQNISFFDALDKLYFSQLKEIIMKNWKSYEGLFSDRVKFEQFFEIINTFRVDAHAREIDEEDEALLTTAFKFFEKALEE